MDAKPTPSAHAFPADMINAITTAAERTADAVGYFLRELGLRGSPQQPLQLPAGFLLHLAAALRLFAWESQGFTFHRAAGLPTARQALIDAFDARADTNTDPTELRVAILRLSVERLAWNGLRY